jgi:hypothetical protein
MDFGASVDVLRVSVNVGNSLGSSGISTALAPSMTVGTGFFGRSSLTENLEPRHLVQWTRMAYPFEADEAMANFAGLIPWEAPTGPVPPYPVASNLAADGSGTGGHPGAAGRTQRQGDTPAPAKTVHAGLGGGESAVPDAGELREVIRRIVIEELAQFAGGFRG